MVKVGKWDGYLRLRLHDRGHSFSEWGMHDSLTNVGFIQHDGSQSQVSRWQACVRECKHAERVLALVEVLSIGPV